MAMVQPYVYTKPKVIIFCEKGDTLGQFLRGGIIQGGGVMSLAYNRYCGKWRALIGQQVDLSYRFLQKWNGRLRLYV